MSDMFPELSERLRGWRTSGPEPERCLSEGEASYGAWSGWGVESEKHDYRK